MKPPELTVIQRAVLKHLPTLRLPPGARVLDAPCGGSAALTLALIEKGLHAIGADVDPKAETHLGSAFAKVDLNAVLPWPDQSFDAIFSTEGIEHLENQTRRHPGSYNAQYHRTEITCALFRKRLFRPRLAAAERIFTTSASSYWPRNFPRAALRASYVRLPVNGSAPHAHQADKLFIRNLRALDVALHKTCVSQGKGRGPEIQEQGNSGDPAFGIPALRGVSDAGREKGVTTKLRGMGPPKRMKRLAVRSRSAKRFRPFCNFCTSFLSSLVPDVSLLSARRFTSSYLGD